MEFQELQYTVLELQAKILQWVAFPFSRGSSQPRDRTEVSHNAGGFFTSWATREAQSIPSSVYMSASISQFISPASFS